MVVLPPCTRDGRTFIDMEGIRGRACTALALALILTVAGIVAPAPPAGAATFSDVPLDHDFHTEITEMADRGVIDGYGDGTFRPTAAVTRQAMAAFLWRVKGRPAPSPTAPEFPDVPVDHPFRDAIRWMAGATITTGYADGTFRPTAPVTRQAAAAFLWRAENRPAPSPTAPSFPDVPPGHQFYEPIRWLAGRNVTTGYADGTFRPDTTVSRQAAAAFLHRLYPPPRLNFSLPPVYGSTALTAGFVPDPFVVGVAAGGPVDVSYLGGGCTGHTTSAPAFSVNYTAGAFPTLRFYSLATVDTVMVINTPGGSYVCVDDSFGTLHPTIDFNGPSSGRYDVWIARFQDGPSVPATLYVTESTGNHP